MSTQRSHRTPWLRAALPLLTLMLAGCDMVVMNPSGDIAAQQADLVRTATYLMLLIIVPVILLTLLFAWRYRASNTDAPYTPDWDHSTRLELVIWGAPLLIIIALGAVTWISTHKLDPFRPLERIDAQRPLPADVKPLVVQVVALDWKWLFLYPEEGIATVNELAAPVDRPIRFHITASTVMNTFYVPALAGMIYAMPGMESQLHAVINKPGEYQGLSANYSGDGFSHMRFKFHGLSDADFQAWVQRNRTEGQGQALSREAYLKLEQPSEREPVRRFAQVDPKLFEAIVGRCVDSSKMCMHQMMAIDAAGGGGKGGIDGLTSRSWRGTERTTVAALCTPNNIYGDADDSRAAVVQR
ncbi:ubiquinol oxidase subunit II [Azohydromonas caseinilytica]|uniref:Ubiquinol oxidase subunit 2 n=1 Tax=Azohydromonas caseinilytica TaxID=2728836 RepID=A0A848F8P3_9BURK|nr:ubiquinol oxidase subunit II [Azohydromonas caseinilytica]NML16507.1 ubiquinol oxidase subunit II [Azohydromonas caseinilytica]